MHPNAYLAAHWRAETLDQVFVAMSFDNRFTDRFAHVIAPAIEAEPIAGYRLNAHRVDISKSGDSILSEIANGVAHSRVVLADVSVVDEGRYRETPIRNGNVMYEVGLALACRMPSEVLLIRDDSKPFLFDVSSIPHLTIDFSDTEKAQSVLRLALADRIAETDGLHDARVRMAVRAMTQHELRVLTSMLDLQDNQARHFAHPALASPSQPDEQGISGLLRKGCIRSVGINPIGAIFYKITPFGRLVARASETYLEKLAFSDPDPEAPRALPAN